MVLNGHLLKHWSSTQATASLSSGEAETKSVTKGAIEGLYMKHLLAQQGVEVEIEILTDATAAIGAVKRLGAGKRMRHLEVQELWVQQLVRNKLVRIAKLSTSENPADILTKHVGRIWLDAVCQMLNVSFPEEEPFGKKEESDDESVGSPASQIGKQEEQWAESFQRATGQLDRWPRYN